MLWHILWEDFCVLEVYICINLSIKSSWGVAIMPSKLLLLHVIPLQKQCKTCIACLCTPTQHSRGRCFPFSPPPARPPWWKLRCWPGYLCHTGIREVLWTIELTNFLKEFERKVVGVVSYGHLRVFFYKSCQGLIRCCLVFECTQRFQLWLLLTWFT